MKLFVIRNTETLRKRTLVFVDWVGIWLIKGPNAEVVLNFVFDVDIADHGVGIGLRTAGGSWTPVFNTEASGNDEFVI